MGVIQLPIWINLLLRLRLDISFAEDEMIVADMLEERKLEALVGRLFQNGYHQLADGITCGLGLISQLRVQALLNGPCHILAQSLLAWAVHHADSLAFAEPGAPDRAVEDSLQE